MKRNMMKKLLVMLLALCLTLLPVIGGFADEAVEGSTESQPVAEEKPAPAEQPQEPPQPQQQEPPKEEPPKQEEPPQQQEEEKQDDSTSENPNPDETTPDNPDQSGQEQGNQEQGDQGTGEQEKESSGDGDAQTPGQDSTQDTETPVPDATLAPTADASADATSAPEETPPVLMMMDAALPMAVSEGFSVDDSGVLTVTKKNVTIVELNSEISGAGKSVTTIKIESGCVLSGIGVITQVIQNAGTISDGTFNGKVTNNEKGKITGGIFQGEVINEKNATISAGTFGARVENNGSISGGKFEFADASTALENHGTISNATINRKIVAYDDSTAENCTFGEKAEATLEGGKKSGIIGISFYFNNKKWNGARFGSNTISMLNQAVTKDKVTIKENEQWYYYPVGEDEESMQLLTEPTMGLKECVYLLATGPIYVVKTPKTIEEVMNDIANASPSKVYKEIAVKEGGILSGEETPACDLIVRNYGTISSGKYSSSVINYVKGQITGGTFDDEVENRGTVSGGTFTQTATLHNFNKVDAATVDGSTVIAEDKSTATNCKFSGTPKIEKKDSGSVTVYYYLDKQTSENRKSVEYGTKVSVLGENKTTTSKTSTKTTTKTTQWYRKKVGETKEEKIDPKTLTFGTTEYIYYSKTTTKEKNTGSGSGSSSSGGSSSSSSSDDTSPTASPTATADAYSWEDDLDSASEEEAAAARERIVEEYLQDGENSDFGIIQDTEGKGSDYELIAVLPEDPDAEAADALGDGGMTSGSAPAYNWDDEEEEEAEEPTPAATEDPAAAAAAAALEAAAVPGEADAEGVVPATLLVRAKGNGSQTRKLTLTLSQIQRIAREQEIEVLLFRNGATTLSMDVPQFYHGNIAKLMKLMLGWRENNVNFAEQDISAIDFDAIVLEDEEAAEGEVSAETGEAEEVESEEVMFEEDTEMVLADDPEAAAEEEEEGVDVESVYTEEQLREFRLELTIAPATPVGYSVRAELRLGDEALEISSLLEKMGITLHADEVEQEVAVYYLDEAQQRYKLDTHRGRVPGVEDRVKGYEVSFANDETSVMALDRSVSNDEFAGYCAIGGGSGTYYIGVLPTTSATPGGSAA